MLNNIKYKNAKIKFINEINTRIKKNCKYSKIHKNMNEFINPLEVNGFNRKNTKKNKMFV